MLTNQSIGYMDAPVPKDIDLKKLEKYGKVVKLNERKLFNTKDALF